MAWLMCPQFCSLTGEKKWRRIMMVMLAKTETLANRMLANNITKISRARRYLVKKHMVAQPMRPSRQLVQWKYRKFGRKFGAEASSRPRQAVLTALL